MRRYCRFPCRNRPPEIRRKPSRSTLKNQQRTNRKSPPFRRAFLLIRQSGQPKKSVSSRFMPNQQRPEDRHSRIPRSVASRRTRHKEETTRLPILRLQVRAKRAAATEKEPTTPHESGAAQRLEKGERLPGMCCDTERRPPECLTPFPAPLKDTGGRSARRKRRRPRVVSSSRVARFGEGGGEFEGGGNTLLRAS